jgi:hypothetical protein
MGVPAVDNEEPAVEEVLPSEEGCAGVRSLGLRHSPPAAPTL